MANTMETIVQIGRAGVIENVIRQADGALAARELIKLRVLDGAPLSPREAADAVAQATGAEVVQVIGTRFVLYRPNPEKPTVSLKMKGVR